MKVRFSLTEWGKQEEVQKAWRQLAQKHDLALKEIPDPERILAFTDGALLGGAVISYSMDKVSLPLFVCGISKLTGFSGQEDGMARIC